MVGEEIARRKQEMRVCAARLINLEIPHRVRRKLAAGGYQVTCYGANGERVTLVQEVLGGLEPNLHDFTLKGDGAVYLGVRVTPFQEKAQPLGGSRRPHPTSRRPHFKRTDFRESDAVLLPEMHALIESREVASAYAAGIVVSAKAQGPGSAVSKAKRLASRYLEWRVGQS